MYDLECLQVLTSPGQRDMASLIKYNIWGSYEIAGWVLFKWLIFMYFERWIMFTNMWMNGLDYLFVCVRLSCPEVVNPFFLTIDLFLLIWTVYYAGLYCGVSLVITGKNIRKPLLYWQNWLACQSYSIQVGGCVFHTRVWIIYIDI